MRWALLLLLSLLWLAGMDEMADIMVAAARVVFVVCLIFFIDGCLAGILGRPSEDFGV